MADLQSARYGDKTFTIPNGSGVVDQTYDATSANAQSGTAVAEAINRVGLKVWQVSLPLSGEETRQIDLPSNVFAYNLVFSNASGFCDNYTHFGKEIGARNIVLRNSAVNANMYFYLSATGELRTNTSATGIQMQLQALYFEK